MPPIFQSQPKLDAHIISEAVQVITSGGIIAYPTDTVYGLGTNALNTHAVKKVFQVKLRPLHLPLSVAVSGITMAQSVAVLNQRAQKLVKFFWPGALTIIVNKRPILPNLVTSGTDVVGLRVPCHRIPLSIIGHSRLPIISTSANKHGEPPCIDAECILHNFGDQIDMIIDEGRGKNEASTVIDVTTNPPIIRRRGSITPSMIERVIGKVILKAR